MIAYIVRRLLWLIPVAILGITLVFIMVYILPGSAALTILGSAEGISASPEQIAELEAELGLDQPLHVQYGRWFWGVLHLDFGNSLWTGQPVMEEIGLRLPISFVLVTLAVLLSVIIAVPVGVLSALRQDSWIDYVARGIAMIGLSVPGFVVGIFVILALLAAIQWSVPLHYAPFYKEPLTALQQLILPALCLCFRTVGIETRMMRSCMLEVIREDYIRTARSKGLVERSILWGHALKNALLPVITSYSVEVVVFFSGAVVIETLFNVPGMGSFLAHALERRDIHVIQGVLLLILFFVMILNLVVDLIYAWLDPRIRYH